MVAELTSGTALVDELIDGVHVGDNLVFQGDAQATLSLLVDRFVAAVAGVLPLVRVHVAGPAPEAVPDGVTVLDWSAVRTGVTSPTPGALPPEATLDDAVASLRDADERAGVGAAFVFDHLDEVADAFGPDAALELFLWACPRLYRRRSLAVWPVLAGRHRPTFLRRLAEITQVVVEVVDAPEGVRLTVREADGRGSEVVGRTVAAEVVHGDLHGVGTPTSARERLGTMLRGQRLARGLAQAEVARRVGITPSALSQVERGVRGPSGDTLLRLWDVLGVPFGEPQARAGYAVERRSGRERRTLQPGLRAELVVDDPAVGQVWHVEVAAGATGDRAPFAAKGAEVATVLRGVVDVTLEGRRETLSEGDALVATTSPVTAWANPGSAPAELLWTIRR